MGTQEHQPLLRNLDHLRHKPRNRIVAALRDGLRPGQPETETYGASPARMADWGAIAHRPYCAL
jgi:hypothetical protein